MTLDPLRAVWRGAWLAAPLVLAACAADEISLAPPSPAKPWPIPGVEANPATPFRIPPSPVPTDHQTGPQAAGAGGATAPVAERLALGSPNSTPPQSASDTQTPPAANAIVIDPKHGYDLAELVDLAERNNPETHEAWEKARQAALAVGLVESTYVPQISAELLGGFQHTPLPIPTSLIAQGYFTANTRELLPTLAVKWLLFDFGRRSGAEDAARANSFVANVAFTGAHQRLMFNVSRDYFSLGAARGKLRAAEQALKSTAVVEDAVMARRAQGLATVVEVAQARRQSAEARFNLERARGAERAAYQALIASMGIESPMPLAVADSSQVKLPAMPSQTVDRFVDEALSSRPDVIAAAAKIRGAEATLREKQADYYPTVSLSAQAYRNIGDLSAQGSRYYSVNETGGNILLQLSWTLFDGGAREARTAAARSEVSAAHDSLNQARDLAVKNVNDSYDALKTGLAEHDAAIALRVAAQTAYDAALDAYRHGVGTYTDLVHDETSLTQAQSEFEDARANSFSAAAALAFSTGSILSSRDPR
jgi:outer membrane protein TolC